MSENNIELSPEAILELKKIIKREKLREAYYRGELQCDWREFTEKMKRLYEEDAI